MITAVLAPWHICSQNPCFSQNGCATEPAQVLCALETFPRSLWREGASSWQPHDRPSLPACSRSPSARFSSPVQALAVSVPPSSATLVLCRGDLQLLVDPLRLFLAQVIDVQQPGHERRQDNTLALAYPIYSTRGEGRNMASRYG
jgi:hypothetical protein